MLSQYKFLVSVSCQRKPWGSNDMTHSTAEQARLQEPVQHATLSMHTKLQNAGPHLALNYFMQCTYTSSVSHTRSKPHTSHLSLHRPLFFLAALLLPCRTEVAERTLRAIAASLAVVKRARLAVTHAMTCGANCRQLWGAKFRLFKRICKSQGHCTRLGRTWNLRTICDGARRA